MALFSAIFAPDLILVSDEPFALTARLGCGDVEKETLIPFL
jgi:hypothetical protein